MGESKMKRKLVVLVMLVMIASTLLGCRELIDSYVLSKEVEEQMTGSNQAGDEEPGTADLTGTVSQDTATSEEPAVSDNAQGNEEDFITEVGGRRLSDAEIILINSCYDFTKSTEQNVVVTIPKLDMRTRGAVISVILQFDSEGKYYEKLTAELDGRARYAMVGYGTRSDEEGMVTQYIKVFNMVNGEMKEDKNWYKIIEPVEDAFDNSSKEYLGKFVSDSEEDVAKYLEDGNFKIHNLTNKQQYVIQASNLIEGYYYRFYVNKKKNKVEKVALVNEDGIAEDIAMNFREFNETITIPQEAIDTAIEKPSIESVLK